jgi:histidinol-phosphate/aromatic aminotransferase/cobyric acid decarboxylase-like protein/adenosyl cobinamide kinase/adenosyl cobinamide phosphate guanylyltransferase
MSLTLVLGGVRSGKSAWAEREAARLAGRHAVLVLVSGDESDPAMVGRIAAHRARRPAHWRSLPLHGLEPGALGPAAELVSDTAVLLVDGLGGWLARLLHETGAFDDDCGHAQLAAAQREVLERARGVVRQLVHHAGESGQAVIVVSEEAGLGMLPIGRAANVWLDVLGTVNQEISAAADRALLVAAGRVVELPALGVATEPDAPAAGDLVERAAVSGDRAAGTMGPEALAALRRHGDRLVRPGDADHAVNVDAEGAPEWLVGAITAEASDRSALSRYPDDSAAREALAALYGRAPEEVVPAAGAAQLLWALAPAFSPRLAACIHPGFTEAEAGLRAHGVAIERVVLSPEQEFELDPAAVPHEADLVVLGNPAAACGRLHPRDAILALRRPGRVIVVDEAFLDQVPGEPGSFAHALADRPLPPDVVAVRSFTKSLAIAGVRAGAALAPEPLAERLRAALPPWAVSAPALAAMVAIAGRADEIAARADRAQRERQDLLRRLGAIPGVRAWPSVTNHLLVHHQRGAQLASALRARGIAVRPCGTFPGLTDDHLRITARDAAANARLAAAITLALEGVPA